MSRKQFGGVVALLAAALIGYPAAAMAAGTQFDFDGGIAPSFGPGNLEYFNGTTTSDVVSFGTASGLGLPALPGGDATVISMPAFQPDQSLALDPGVDANGGGSFINEFTMVWDILVPDISANWFSFFNSNPANANDGDFFIRSSDGGIGISGDYHGSMISNQWHRVAVSIDLTAPTMDKYIDGTLVGSQALDGVDGRCALYTTTDVAQSDSFTLLFGDNNAETSAAYLSSFYFTDEALDAQAIGALGGPTAAGVIPEPSTLAMLSGIALLAVGCLWRRRR